MKIVKFLKDGILKEGIYYEDKHFHGGAKVEYLNEDGTTTKISINYLEFTDETKKYYGKK